MIQFKQIYLTVIFLYLCLLQVNFIYAEASLDIPDDIVDDWDEAVIEQNRKNIQKAVPAKKHQTARPKNLKNNSIIINENFQRKQQQKTQSAAKTLKPYKSPLHKPILYQKIYIREKHQ
jgi:hypothetical protein